MKKLIIFIFLIQCVNANAHKFYISIADMEYDSTKNRINVSVKMTAHDFEGVLKRKYKQVPPLEELSDTSEVGQYMCQYLDHNFQLYSNDKRMKMNYLGKEVNVKDELFFYFFFSDIPNYTTVKIINRLLFSISDQQQNIVHYKYGDRTKSVTLIPAKPEAWITFEGKK